MTCKKAARLLQLYTDGRLPRAQHASLERHLAECAACREESALLDHIVRAARDEELIPEPADLTQRVLDRIAVYEARRAARTQEWMPAPARWAVGWRAVLAAMMVLAALALLQPGAFATFTQALSRHAELAYNLLMTPGPDSISWWVWAAGALVVGVFMLWFVRAEASAGWRRAISQRFPQLW